MNIDMWSFAGVLLAILIILMCNTPPYHYHPFGLVDFPSSVFAAVQPKAIREDSIRIQLARDGVIFFRNVRVGSEDLPELIRKAVEVGAERKVYLSADARAKFGDVKVVYDAIAASGVKNVCVLTEKTGTK